MNNLVILKREHDLDKDSDYKMYSLFIQDVFDKNILTRIGSLFVDKGDILDKKTFSLTYESGNKVKLILDNAKVKRQ